MTNGSLSLDAIIDMTFGDSGTANGSGNTTLATLEGTGGLGDLFDAVARRRSITFDYRMRPDVVRKSNALALMRAVGLDV